MTKEFSRNLNSSFIVSDTSCFASYSSATLFNRS
jgi:hypothetical protein